jgi:hypothetical protein
MQPRNFYLRKKRAPVSIDDYAIDRVLHETHAVITELKNQLAMEENKLSQLESQIPAGISYNDANDYSSPAWFGS